MAKKKKEPVMEKSRKSALKKLLKDFGGGRTFKEAKIEPIVKYTPVNKNALEKGYTSLKIIPYYHSRGLIMRSEGKSTIVGYCVENPLEVLERVFPEYHVTAFNGYHLFDTSDFKRTTPMIGLGINKFPAHRGIKGTLNELLEVEDVQKLKKNKPIQKAVLNRITKNLKNRTKHNHLWLSPSFKQLQYDTQKTIEVLKHLIV